MFRDPVFSLSIELTPVGHPAGSFLGTDRLSVWILKAAIVEFIVVGASSYLTSAIYPTPSRYRNGFRHPVTSLHRL